MTNLVKRTAKLSMSRKKALMVFFLLSKASLLTLIKVLGVAWKQVANDEKDNFEKRSSRRRRRLITMFVVFPSVQKKLNIFIILLLRKLFGRFSILFLGILRSETSDWENFKNINRLFAEAACDEAADDALIWIHDYNLWLAAKYIREQKPNARIAFFHHTPFPSVDIFNILPWREEIVESLLCCDIVGFHIPRYSENFVNVARRYY